MRAVSFFILRRGDPSFYIDCSYPFTDYKVYKKEPYQTERLFKYVNSKFGVDLSVKYDLTFIILPNGDEYMLNRDIDYSFDDAEWDKF